jgi:hypothetical protein
LLLGFATLVEVVMKEEADAARAVLLLHRRGGNGDSERWREMATDMGGGVALVDNG